MYEKNLIEACENGNGDLIRILLVSHNANPNIWTKVMAYISNYYEIAIILYNYIYMYVYITYNLRSADGCLVVEAYW